MLCEKAKEILMEESNVQVCPFSFHSFVLSHLFSQGCIFFSGKVLDCAISAILFQWFSKFFVMMHINVKNQALYPTVKKSCKHYEIEVYNNERHA